MNASVSAGLVPVHVAVTDPEQPLAWGEVGSSSSVPAEPPRTGWEDVRWSDLGVEPRWLGHETSDCAAAFNPSSFFGRGDAEFKRFLRGAQAREEVALIVATIGETLVMLPGARGSITGKRLPARTLITLAPHATGADRDLGLRLLNRPEEAPWWAVSAGSIFLEGPRGSEVRTPQGELLPVLVDPLGEPVVAVWVPEDSYERWYIIPDATDWNIVVGWLVQQALPALAPGALRRVRSPHFSDPTWESPAELRARQALADLEASYALEKARLEEELRTARDQARPLRDGLLYGTARELEEAVAAVLTAAGFAVEQLDDQLGTKSADLLAVLGGEARLVEVKSAGGAASEKLVDALRKHLETWTKLRPDRPIGGGALVVNHEHKREPAQRSREVYSRPEFVDALSVPVQPGVVRLVAGR